MKICMSTILAIAFLIMPSLVVNEAIATEKPVTQSQVKQTKVNLNKASIEQLSTLKGIGIKKAEAIVEYRSTYGKFKSVDDLLNVSGIGEKFIAKNKMYLEI